MKLKSTLLLLLALINLTAYGQKITVGNAKIEKIELKDYKKVYNAIYIGSIGNRSFYSKNVVHNKLEFFVFENDMLVESKTVKFKKYGSSASLKARPVIKDNKILLVAFKSNKKFYLDINRLTISPKSFEIEKVEHLKNIKTIGKYPDVKHFYTDKDYNIYTRIPSISGKSKHSFVVYDKDLNITIVDPFSNLEHDIEYKIDAKSNTLIYYNSNPYKEGYMYEGLQKINKENTTLFIQSLDESFNDFSINLFKNNLTYEMVDFNFHISKDQKLWVMGNLYSDDRLQPSTYFISSIDLKTKKQLSYETIDLSEFMDQVKKEERVCLRLNSVFDTDHNGLMLVFNHAIYFKTILHNMKTVHVSSDGKIILNKDVIKDFSNFYLENKTYIGSSYSTIFLNNTLYNFYRKYEGPSQSFSNSSSSTFYLNEYDVEKNQNETESIKNGFMHRFAFSPGEGGRMIQTNNENIFIFIVEPTSITGQCYKITLN